MRWKILLQCETDAGSTETVELCQLNRDVAPTLAGLGLQHREA